MKRETKFRAWDGVSMSVPFNPKLCDSDILPAGTDFVWLQYTGLKDKNGKEIYEGDIVDEFLSDAEDENYLYHGVVKYLGVEFCLKIKEDCYIKLKNTGHNLEVIGNIYENPKLIN